MQGNNPFNPILLNLSQGYEATIQIWGDSTTVIGESGGVFGTQDRRYIGLWLDQLISTGRLDAIAPAGCGIRVYKFLNGTYNFTYNEIIRASSSGQWLTIFLGGVSGATPHYLMGGYYRAGLGGISADALLIALGINIATWGDEAFYGTMMCAVEQYRMDHPETAVGFITQHPNRDATTYDPISRILKRRAALLRASVNDDAFAEFIAAGKPSNYYNGDGIHESTPVGCQPYIRALNRWWDQASPAQGQFVQSRFSIPAGRTQLLKNGDFSTWTNTSAAPDGWGTLGNPVFAKDTAIYADERKSFSVRMTSTGSTATRITQSIPIVTGMKTVTLAARMRKDTAGGNNLGRISLSYNATSGNGAVTNPGHVIQQNGFAWWAITVDLPLDMTSATVSVYADSTAPPDATYGVWLDQVSCVTGPAPLAFV